MFHLSDAGSFSYMPKRDQGNLQFVTVEFREACLVSWTCSDPVFCGSKPRCLSGTDSENHWTLCAMTNHAIFTLKLQLPLFSSGKEIKMESRLFSFTFVLVTPKLIKMKECQERGGDVNRYLVRSNSVVFLKVNHSLR